MKDRVMQETCEESHLSIDQKLDYSIIHSIFSEAFPFTNITRKQIADIAGKLSVSAKKIHLVISPLARYAQRISDTLISISPVIQELSILGTVSKKLGEKQYVLWEHLSTNELRAAFEEVDIDKFIEKHVSYNDFALLNEITISLLNEPLLEPVLPIYKQLIFAFDNGHYGIAAIGLTSVIDCLLSKVSNNNTTKMIARCENILSLIDEGMYFEHTDYESVTLIYTFWLAIETFSKTVDFKDTEPPELNRHWIMHGRSTRFFQSWTV